MLKMSCFNVAKLSEGDCQALSSAAAWIETGSDERLSGFGWMRLPDEDISSILEASKWLRDFESVVQVGIGGSSLGNLMLHQALLPPYFNERTDRGGPRFYMADNLDGEENQAIWELVDPEKTGFIVVSKSGLTIETMANFSFFWEKLKERLGEAAASRVLVITDSDQGVLRRFAKDTGCRSLSLPGDVGGRFSVLSSVGLLSAATLGIDVQEILAGARDMKYRISTDVEESLNPAWVMAWNMFRQLDFHRTNTVFMPYGDRMERLSEWFCQLWAESLGKEGMGFTPQRALGAIDQHSQLQLYSQGPDDKCYIVLGIDSHTGDPLSIGSEPSLAELSYLNGLSQEEILGHERRAVVAVLAGEGKPVFSFSLNSLNCRSVGGLIFFLEYVTALTGRLMRIQPFDQPGVELGKKYANGLAGRGEDLSYASLVEEVEERHRTLDILF